MTTNGPRDGAGLGPATQLARLLRAAGDVGLMASTRALLKSQIMSELGGQPETDGELFSEELPQAPDLPSRVQPTATKQARPLSAGGAQKTDGPRPSPTLPAVRKAGLAPAAVDLKLRQMVDAQADWHHLEPLIDELWQMQPSAATAARVTELAFLHAPPPEVNQWLERFSKEAPRNFWAAVHPAVRARLVPRLGIRHSDALTKVVYRDKDAAWLSNLERLCVFRTLLLSEDQASAYIYFRAHQKDILEAGTTFGVASGLPLAALLLAVGRLALAVGSESEARELLARIPEGAAERDEALRVLLDATTAKNRANQSHYVERLVAEPTGRGRVELLAAFFSATRGLGGFRDRNRPALNELLRNPLAWLGEAPESVAALSMTLVAHRDLEPLLPNLYDLFRAKAATFGKPAVEAAIWQGPSTIGAASEADAAPRDLYWRGVGLLHRFVASGPVAEALLWEAFDAIAAARAAWRQAAPFGWTELHKAAYTWVAKSHYIDESDRAKMLRQLRVVVDPSALTIEDVTEYAAHVGADAPLPALVRLERVAAGRGAPTLAWRLALRKAALSHLTNADLDRLWRVAIERREPDLAWRTATILAARGKLAPGVRHAWEISGEKRSQYALVSITQKDVDAVIADLPTGPRRLAHALIAVGGKMPELLAALDPTASVSRVGSAPSGSVEARYDKFLAGLPWVPPLKRRYRFRAEAVLLGGRVPRFAQVLPVNPWTALFTKLTERFGIDAWGWRLSFLRDAVEGLLPKLAHRDGASRCSAKVARWLKELTPEQRAAWQEFVNLSRSMDDEAALLAIAGLVCRLTVMLLPNHHLALTSLQAMRAQVAVLWDLETFILSEPWMMLRRQHGIAARVPVPDNLARRVSIVGEPCGDGPRGATVMLPMGRR